MLKNSGRKFQKVLVSFRSAAHFYLAYKPLSTLMAIISSLPCYVTWEIKPSTQRAWLSLGGAVRVITAGFLTLLIITP